MSYASIIEFGDDGKPAQTIKFSNSWGGHMRIWDSMCKHHFGKGNTFLFITKQLFDLLNGDQLHVFERTVLLMTADWAIVRRENYQRVASALRTFREIYPTTGECHLEAWAEHFDQCKAPYIGFQGTSVSEYMWSIYNEDDEEEMPYDLNSMNKHFFVGDDMGELWQE